jgi:signal transduction histidine kinase
MPDAGCLAETYLEQSPACHWIVGADGVFRAVYGDPAAIFGRSAGELAGKPVAEVLDSEATVLWKSRFARALAGELVLLRERHSGATWYMGVFPIRVEGRILFAGGLASEATPFSTAEQELRSTVLGALKAQEYERSAAARFLHDVVGQNLTALGLQLDLVRMDLESVQPETCLRIGEMQNVLESMMGEVREYSHELNPSTVERAGLRPALDRLVARVRKRFSGSIRLNVDPSLKLDPGTASAIFHIAQEAILNSVQHSSCSTIEIAVKSTRSGPSLEVRDNGRGFDPDDILGGHRGLGLMSMEHYAAEAGLDLSVLSDQATGTIVRAGAPKAA